MRRNIKQLSTEELLSRYKIEKNTAADGIRRMADLWCELVDRGEDMPAIDPAMAEQLLAVHEGRLLPEALMRRSDFPALMAALATLSRARAA